jgi:hypothetical protein
MGALTPADRPALPRPPYHNIPVLRTIPSVRLEP